MHFHIIRNGRGRGRWLNTYRQSVWASIQTLWSDREGVGVGVRGMREQFKLGYCSNDDTAGKITSSSKSSMKEIHTLRYPSHYKGKISNFYDD